uniref:Uncharacterized protein n=1 Tax=Peronospora matthiolae TaxID=2874970 RepID=A0AAV1T6V6_9STRA
MTSRSLPRPPAGSNAVTAGSSTARRAGRNAPSATPSSRRVDRYVPADSLFQALEEATANNAPPADFRSIAMLDVQRARVAVSEKLKLFIPCGTVAGASQLDEIMLSIHTEDQAAL